MSTARDWLSLGPDAANEDCPHHGGACAFSALSPARCPWCHSLWAVVLRTSSHSCEKAGTWPGRERQWRVRKAQQMRQQAARELDQEPLRVLPENRSGDLLRASLSAMDDAA